MEIIKIVRRERNLLEILMIIWEDSVRHTHDFLRESDIKALRPLVYKNLESIPELWAIKAEDSCYKGFMGIDGIKLWIHIETTSAIAAIIAQDDFLPRCSFS